MITGTTRAVLQLAPIGTAVHGWEVAIARGHASWWVVVYDGLSTHEGPERPDEGAASNDIGAVLCHLEDLVIAAKRATGMAGAN